MTLLKRLEKSRHGQKAEVRASKRLGGRLQPGSGCISESLSLKLEWLRKISKEAADITKEPALTIQFVDGSGRPVLDGAWVMVPERVFKEIIGG